MRIFGIVKPKHIVMASTLLASYPIGVWAQDVDEVAGVIQEYCTKCHNFEDYSGGIDLEGIGAHCTSSNPLGQS